ncbi:hypothetical protein SORBI_3002G430800, partial [Sorghum bicolor]
STPPPSQTLRAAAAPQHTAPNAPHLHLLPVKEHQIVEQLVPGLKDEVMKITPVQRTRFKAFVVVGEAMDTSGSASSAPRRSLRPSVAPSSSPSSRSCLSGCPSGGGTGGTNRTAPHRALQGHRQVRLRHRAHGAGAQGGSGIVAAYVPKKVLQFAGIEDVFTSSRRFTKTLGNFVKVRNLEHKIKGEGTCSGT